jgi:lipopolysaccharide/colanic/teichoic acid biosynthesis glycosyltransferase
VYPNEFQAILQIRPGLSDYASINYRHEESLLANASEPEKQYVQVILPDKLHLAQQYVENISLVTDCTIMCETIKAIFLREDETANSYKTRCDV